ncbi:MAG: mechanosensitive ion channel family protein [Pseudomonadota bacterium]
MNYIHDLLFALKDNWIVQVFIVIFFSAVIHYIEVIFYNRTKPKLAAKANRVWFKAFFHAIHKPVGALIWLVGITFAISIVQAKAPGAAIFNFVQPLRDVGVIVIIVWSILRFIKQGEEILVQPRGSKPGRDKTTVNAISQILTATVVITSILVVLQTLGFKISGVLALGSVSGIVAGFAAKDLLANFFGGLMVYFDRPFKVGDWIRSPDRQIEGTVEYIGWRLCRIRTFDKRPLYVPNSIFSTISVENPSRMLNRRIYTKVGVRYEDATKMRKMLPAIRDMLHNHPEIDTKATLMVNLVEFGPSALNFMIYTFTKTTDWVKFQAIQEDVFLQIIDIIASFGAECAFPTTTIHVPNKIDFKELA